MLVDFTSQTFITFMEWLTDSCSSEIKKSQVLCPFRAREGFSGILRVVRTFLSEEERDRHSLETGVPYYGSMACVASCG